jgi:hypothetical protein
MLISRRVYLKMRLVIHAAVLIKKALLQKCLFKKAFSAVRLSLSTSTFLKTLYFAPPDYSGFAFIVIFFLLTLSLAFTRNK